MRGGNGLSPVENLAERRKCPTHPSKRKWSNTDEAKAEAKRRSRESKLDIVPYLCPDCGFYHLTKSTGGDSMTLKDGMVRIGEFKAKAPTHPVFHQGAESEAPPVPGDRAMRRRFALALLEQTPEPTSTQVMEALSCSKDTVRSIMRELGYRNTNGRTARWVPTDPDPQTVPPATEPTGAPETAESRWLDLDIHAIGHLAVGDLEMAYRAAGLTIRIQAEVPHA